MRIIPTSVCFWEQLSKCLYKTKTYEREDAEDKDVTWGDRRDVGMEELREGGQVEGFRRKGEG